MRQHSPLDPATGLENSALLPWIDGVPQTGTEGSYPGHALMTDQEAEILNVITAALLTPSDDLTQLLQAIRILALQKVTSSGQVPIILQNPVLYVRTDGNDATGDGSANTAVKAFATIGAAAAYGKARYYLAGVALTIQLGNAGTYAAPGNIDCGGGTIIVLGDPANPGNYIVQGAGPAGGASALLASTNGTLLTSGLDVNNTGTINACLAAAGAGSLQIDHVTFGTTVVGSPALVSATSGGTITLFDGCVFGGSANAAMLVSGGYMTMAGNIGLANNPNFASALCAVSDGGLWKLSGSKGFTSTAATGPRFLVNNHGEINTNGSGPGFFPGSSAGTADAATWGLYV